jgi:hypothetical protein
MTERQVVWVHVAAETALSPPGMMLVKITTGWWKSR